MHLRPLVLFLSIFGVCWPALGQTCLVLETRGKIKGRKYPVGSLIKIHFEGEPKSSWETYTITGFDTKMNCIRVSETNCIALSAIDKFDISPAKNNRLDKPPPKFYVQWTYFQYFNGQRKLNKRNRLKIIDYSLPATKS